MIEKLQKLSYGLGEYDKTKIETRLKLIKEILPEININTLEDFEILEQTIYKLKDQLRIKSSNLNKTIQNPSKDLTKQDVLNIIKNLTKIKNSFLQKAISPIQTPPSQIHQIEEEYTPEEEPQPPSQPKTQIAKTQNYEITLQNGKIPYLLIKFKKDPDYILLKNLATTLFETYNAQGTNIIIEKNTALVIPREQNDNLLSLPRIQTDIEKTYKKLTKKEEKKDQKYPEITEPAQKIQTSKKKEDSLDALLGKIEKKHPSFTPPPNPKIDMQEPKIIKEEEKIKIEKQPKKPIEIEIPSPNQIPPMPHEIYRDQKIVAYIEPKSKILGEIKIKTIPEKPLKELSEADLSYVILFSKVFASILFETLSAHGTNILWDFKKNTINIIPRFQEDNLKLKWEPQKNTPEFLEEIKNKITSEMAKELPQKQEQKPIIKEAEVHEKPTEKEPQENKEEKAKYLIDAIRKLP